MRPTTSSSNNDVNNSDDDTLSTTVPHYKVENSKVLEEEYKVTTKLGEGTFGVVMEALHKKSNTKYAIKQIMKSKTSSSSRAGSCQGVVAMPVKSWMHEIRILSSIRHANIVCLNEIIETDQQVFLVMELCDGGSLQKFVQGRPYVSESLAREFMRDLCNALTYLHKKGIVHRDIKLDNLLLKCLSNPPSNPSGVKKGRVEDRSHHRDSLIVKEYSLKIADFGLSVELKKVEDTMIEFCGTPLYMAPEIITGRSYSKQCDVWSMGIIMHVLLLGKTPFLVGAEDNLNQLYREIREWTGFVDKKTNSISRRAARMLERLLHPDPAYRFSASEAAYDPWITGSELADNTQHTNVLELMKEFNTASICSSTDGISLAPSSLSIRAGKDNRPQSHDKNAPRRSSISAGNKPLNLSEQGNVTKQRILVHTSKGKTSKNANNSSSSSRLHPAAASANPVLGRRK